MAINAVESKYSKAFTPVERLSPTQKLKNQRNIALLQASIPTINSTSAPLALVLRTTIQNLTEELESDLGPNSIQRGFDSGIDAGPESTSDRIVNQSAAFFSAYRAQHSDQSDEKALKGFMETIRRGIDLGFSEAGNILKGLNALTTDASNSIDKTYELVQEKLIKFEQTLMPVPTKK